jgi:hypothetical protein
VGTAKSLRRGVYYENDERGLLLEVGNLTIRKTGKHSRGRGMWCSLSGG